MIGADPFPIVRKKRASRNVDPHFTPIQKLGYPDGIRCWCGAELIVRYGEHGVVAKRKHWLDAHDECLPAREGTE